MTDSRTSLDQEKSARTILGLSFDDRGCCRRHLGDLRVGTTAYPSSASAAATTLPTAEVAAPSAFHLSTLARLLLLW